MLCVKQTTHCLAQCPACSVNPVTRWLALHVCRVSTPKHFFSVVPSPYVLFLQPRLLFSAFQTVTQYSHFCWNNTNILCEVPSTSPQLDMTLLSSLLLKTVVQATVSIHNHLTQSFSVDFLDLLSHYKFLEGRITIFLIALSSILKNKKL